MSDEPRTCQLLGCQFPLSKRYKEHGRCRDHHPYRCVGVKPDGEQCRATTSLIKGTCHKHARHAPATRSNVDDPPWVHVPDGSGTSSILPAGRPGVVLAGVPSELAGDLVRTANAWRAQTVGKNGDRAAVERDLELLKKEEINDGN